MATTLNPANHRTNSNTFFVVIPEGDLRLLLPLSLPVLLVVTCEQPTPCRQVQHQPEYGPSLQTS